MRRSCCRPRELSDAALAAAPLDRLADPAELGLIRLLAGWPRIVESAAEAHEPHRIAFFLQEVAAQFHLLWTKGKDEATLAFPGRGGPRADPGAARAGAGGGARHRLGAGGVRGRAGGGDVSDGAAGPAKYDDYEERDDDFELVGEQRDEEPPRARPAAAGDRC